MRPTRAREHALKPEDWYNALVTDQARSDEPLPVEIESTVKVIREALMVEQTDSANGESSSYRFDPHDQLFRELGDSNLLTELEKIDLPEP